MSRTLSKLVMILLFFILIVGCSSLNYIFYLNLCGASHLDFVESMINALVEQGHDVDLLLGLLNTDVKWKGRTKANRIETFGFDGSSPWMDVGYLLDPFDSAESSDSSKFQKDSFKLCSEAMEKAYPIEFMKSGNYNAAIVSEYDYCGFILAKAAGIERVMSFASTNMMILQSQHLGVPNPASIVASNMDKFHGDFSFLGKLQRLLYWLQYLFIDFPTIVNGYNQMVRKHFGENFPNVDELARNSDIMFINSNELIEKPRTITHKVQYIGGIGLKSPKPLSEEYEQILSNSPEGVVIMSFGTQVPPERFNMRVKKIFFNSFRQFSKYTFIWKYTAQPEDSYLLGNTTNVKLVKWLPQTDLLYDKRVVGFITHAGLNSLLEFTHAGVPVVVIPLFADQEHNARNVVRLGTGIQLDRRTFTEKELTESLRLILTDEKIINTTQELSEILARHPYTEKEKFVKWAEFAAQNSNLHKLFNLDEAGMNPIFYYCVDVALITMAIFFGILLFLKYLLSRTSMPAKMKVH